MRILIALALAGILCLNTACATDGRFLRSNASTTERLYHADWREGVEVWEDVKVERAVLTDKRLVLHLSVKTASGTLEDYHKRWATLEILDNAEYVGYQHTLYTSDPLASDSDKGEDVLVAPLAHESLCIQDGEWKGTCLIQTGTYLEGPLLLHQEGSPSKVRHYVYWPLPTRREDQTWRGYAGKALLTPVAVATDLTLVALWVVDQLGNAYDRILP